MSYIDYLPPKKPLQMPKPPGRKHLCLWPSALSLFAHILIIIMLIILGHLQYPVAGEKMETSVVWIRTALLQTEAQAAPPSSEATSPGFVKGVTSENEKFENQENLESNENPPSMPKVSAGEGNEAEMRYVTTAKTATAKPAPARQDITRQSTEKAQVLQNFSSVSLPNWAQLAKVAVQRPAAADKPVELALKNPPAAQGMVIPPPPKEPLRATPTMAATTPPQPVPLKQEKPHPPLTAKVHQGLSPSHPMQASPVPNVTKIVAAGYQSASPVTAQQLSAVVKKSDEIEKKPSSLTILVEEAKKVLPVTAQQPLGLFDAPLKGDIHLELSGRSLIGKTVKISADYRAYPKSRHQRPMSAAEARRVKVLTPKTARVKENVLQLVIETAAEGIYEFRVAEAEVSAMEASCVVTITTGDKKKKVKDVGTKSLSEKTSLVKILMPEGMVWEDDSNFTGSIEDSESITRYNSDTGLVWKEYRANQN